MTADIRADRQGDCLVLTLDHSGTGNALTAGMCAAGVEALSTAQRDAEVHAVILSGAGGRFCSGLQDAAALAPLHDWVLALRDCEPLLIATVEGLAQGAGAALALACDLCVATPDALLRLADPLARDADVGGAQWMARELLPRQSLCEALLPDAGLRGDRLQALGVVNRLHAPGGGLHAALALADAARALAPRRKPGAEWDAQALPLHVHLERQRHAALAQIHTVR